MGNSGYDVGLTVVLIGPATGLVTQRFELDAILNVLEGGMLKAATRGIFCVKRMTLIESSGGIRSPEAKASVQKPPI